MIGDAPMTSPATATHCISLRYYGLDDLGDILESRPFLQLDPEVETRISAGEAFAQAKAAEDRFIYGVNTGFGSLCEVRVDGSRLSELQYNHIVSHACGVGGLASERVARLTLIIKLLTFRSGHTGISLATVQRLLDFWNHGLIPAIPMKGTVGASGDLAPLAHMALPLLGLGQVHVNGAVVSGEAALRERGWTPATLMPKEGLALTNGVQYINAIASDCLLRIEQLVRAADVIAALSLQAFSASRTFYQARYVATSHNPERQIVAANLRRLLEGSNHFELPTCNQSRQDPYSFRCIPQVHAAIRQTVRFARNVIEEECNSVSDNPLFFPDDDEILFGGNLHGESTAFVLDYLAIAVSELASISERRTYQLLSGRRGLPDFLVQEPGVNSGFMVVQYTSAALVNENKVHATPASVDTIPTCQLQEDHVSMGGTSGYKLSQIIDNCETVLANELMLAAQAVELNNGLRLSPVTAQILHDYRARIPALKSDRVMSDDMEASRCFLLDRRRQWSSGLGLQ